MNQRIRVSISITLLSIILFLIDQITKWLALKYWQDPLFLIGRSIRFETKLNSEIAFSLPVPGFFVTLLTPLLLYFFIFIFREMNYKTKLFPLIVSLFFSGLLGNFIDRVTHQFAVVDFIAIGWYPVFNLADSYLTLGVLLMIVFYKKIFVWQK